MNKTDDLIILINSDDNSQKDDGIHWTVSKLIGVGFLIYIGFHALIWIILICIAL